MRVSKGWDPRALVVEMWLHNLSQDPGRITEIIFTSLQTHCPLEEVVHYERKFDAATSKTYICSSFGRHVSHLSLSHG